MILVLIDSFLIGEFNGGSVIGSSVFKVINSVLILEMSFYLGYTIFFKKFLVKTS
jgi:hypothetical protein